MYKMIFLFRLLAGCAVFLSFTCCCDGCDDDPYLNSLPPETQEGKDTFGCYVDGRLCVYNSQIDKPSFPYVTIDASYRYGELEVYSDLNTGFMWFRIRDPKEGAINVSEEFYYNPRTEYNLGCKKSGEIYLTRFDTINKVVSGRFYAKLDSIYIRRSAVKDTFLQVTEGRFDIRLD